MNMRSTIVGICLIAGAAQAKLNPGYHHPPATLSAADAHALQDADRRGALLTLPHWSGQFAIQGLPYRYTMLGGDPAAGGTTHISTLIVPVRLYVMGARGGTLFDGMKATASVLGSPIFQASHYDSGNGQFGDAMLRTEFSSARSWHTVLDASVARPIDIVAPLGTAQVLISASGHRLAVVANAVIDYPINAALHSGRFSPAQNVVFVTYNALENAAFGYHGAVFLRDRSVEQVYSYNSWLEGVDDLFTVPSPNATTMTHEIAETLHDAFNGALSSRTKLWGDPFNLNRCFQTYIEVGDAVENASAAVQLRKQRVRTRTYTVQNEALLPWFTREMPSPALFGAYSFPSRTALTAPAPLNCSP